MARVKKRRKTGHRAKFARCAAKCKGKPLKQFRACMKKCL